MQLTAHDPTAGILTAREAIDSHDLGHLEVLEACGEFTRGWANMPLDGVA